MSFPMTFLKTTYTYFRDLRVKKNPCLDINVLETVRENMVIVFQMDTGVCLAIFILNVA